MDRFRLRSSSRVSQQVLEYLHVPHDLPLAPKHQLLLAQSKIKDKDLDEGTPDHPGEPLETAEVNERRVEAPQAERGAGALLAATADSGTEAWYRRRCGKTNRRTVRRKSDQPKRERKSGAQPKLPTSGTVVLDVEQGGIEVPSFVGKTFRGAVETAQDVGLELEAVGSGVARAANPTAGTHVPAGSRVTVQFGRLASADSDSTAFTSWLRKRTVYWR